MSRASPLADAGDYASGLPQPLAYPLQEARRLAEAGAYGQAVSHLVDLGEAFIQLYTAAALACLTRHPSQITLGLRLEVESFLTKPPSIGTWLQLWTHVAHALADADPADPFLAVARFAAPDNGARQGTLAELTTLPNFRNRTRHSRTLPDDRALEVLTLRWPHVRAVLQQAWILFADYALAVVVERDGAVAVLHNPTGRATMAEAREELIEVDGPAVAGDVVLVRRGGSGQPGARALLALGPLLRWTGTEIAVYFRATGAGRVSFVTPMAQEPEGRMEEVRAQLSALLPAEAGRRQRPPTWTQGLRHHLLVSRSLWEDQEAEPGSFYLGNPVGWSDLGHNLDVRRELTHDGVVVPAQTFDETHLPELLRRAHAHECPLFLFRGPGGAGKTTVLLRTALELERRFPGEVLVLHLQFSAQLESADILLARSEGSTKAIVLVLDEAAAFARELERFRAHMRQSRCRLGILCAERPNLWPADLAASTDVYDVSPALSRDEARQLLDRLREHDLLGALAELTEADQIAALAERYDRQLLITLREATSGRRFDEIIRSEYTRIPEDDARSLYLAASLTHRCRLPLALATALRYTGRPDWKTFKKDILRKTDGALVVDGADDARFCRTRHARIAEVLCASVGADERGDALSELVHALVDTHQFDTLGALLASEQTAPDLENANPRALAETLVGAGAEGRQVALALLDPLSALPLGAELASRLLRLALTDGGDGDREVPALVNRLLDAADGEAVVLAELSRGVARTAASDLVVNGLAQRVSAAGDDERALSLLESEITRAGHDGRPAPELLLGWTTLRVQRGEIAAVVADRERLAAALAGVPRRLEAVWRMLVRACEVTGEVSTARTLAREGAERFERLGEAGGAVAMWVLFARLSRQAGAAEAALDAARRALAAAVPAGVPAGEGMAEELLALVHLGDHAIAGRRAEELRQHVREGADPGLAAAVQALLIADWRLRGAEGAAGALVQLGDTGAAWTAVAGLSSARLLDICLSFGTASASIELARAVARTLAVEFEADASVGLLHRAFPLATSAAERDAVLGDLVVLADAAANRQNKRERLMIGGARSNPRARIRPAAGALSGCGRPDLAEPLLRQLLPDAMQGSGEWQVMIDLANLLVRRGAIPEARTILDVALRAASRDAKLQDVARAALMDSVALAEGDEAAIKAGHDALVEPTQHGRPASVLRRRIAEALARRGRLGEAIATIEGMVGVAAADTSSVLLVQLLAAAGRPNGAANAAAKMRPGMTPGVQSVQLALVARLLGDEARSTTLAERAVTQYLLPPLTAREHEPFRISLYCSRKAGLDGIVATLAALGTAAWSKSRSPRAPAALRRIEEAVLGTSVPTGDDLPDL